jgi:hypothetical protein
MPAVNFEALLRIHKISRRPERSRTSVTDRRRRAGGSSRSGDPPCTHGGGRTSAPGRSSQPRTGDEQCGRWASLSTSRELLSLNVRRRGRRRRSIRQAPAGGLRALFEVCPFICGFIPKPGGSDRPAKVPVSSGRWQLVDSVASSSPSTSPPARLQPACYSVRSTRPLHRSARTQGSRTLVAEGPHSRPRR